MSDTPVLETARLTLRRHVVADFQNTAAMWGDPDVVRYISGKPSSKSESWSRLLRYVGHWNVLGFGYWVVQEKSSESFLGEVGFADYKRDMVPSIEGLPEAGWVLNSMAQGKGYAEEAVRCMFDWADRYLNGDTTVCIVDPEHLASVRLARKLNFEYSDTTTYQGTLIHILERSRKIPCE